LDIFPWTQKNKLVSISFECTIRKARPCWFQNDFFFRKICGSKKVQKVNFSAQKFLKTTLISVALINLGPIGFGLSFSRGFPARTRAGITRFGTG